MNAQELYELVKDWPREAWPEGVVVNPQPDDYPFMGVSDHIGTNPRPTDYFNIPCVHAVLLFEASLMRWLESKTTGGICIETLAHEQNEVFWHVVFAVGWAEADIRGQSLIHALASAVRAIVPPISPVCSTGDSQ